MTKNSESAARPPRRKILFGIAALLAGVALALGGPHVVAWWQARPLEFSAPATADPGAAGITRPEEADWLLVIGRREERRALDDPTPHRNSRVALYRRETSHWAKAEGDLPIRSHSTAMEPLPAAELATRSRGTVRYGFVSVPLGVFSLRQEPWRDGKTPAFLISDWGGHNGTIMLRETQVIRQQTRDADDVTSHQVLRSSTEKQGSWIHPTFTKIWSHGDSDGCINLFRPLDINEMPEGETADYDQFLAWLSSRNLTPGPGNDLPLMIVPFNLIGNMENETLNDTLPLDIIDSACALQGSQIEGWP